MYIIIQYVRKAREKFVSLCVNSDGSDKQVPIVIGKSPKPRCFKNKKITLQIPRELCRTSKVYIVSKKCKSHTVAGKL
jgi:hypothetical protein